MATDGEAHGAMKGCFNKFPQHRFATKMLCLLDKQKEYLRKEWKLPTWDAQILQVIDNFANKVISEADAQEYINTAERQAANYRKYKNKRR